MLWIGVLQRYTQAKGSHAVFKQCASSKGRAELVKPLVLLVALSERWNVLPKGVVESTAANPGNSLLTLHGFQSLELCQSLQKTSGHSGRGRGIAG